MKIIPWPGGLTITSESGVVRFKGSTESALTHFALAIDDLDQLRAERDWLLLLARAWAVGWEFKTYHPGKSDDDFHEIYIPAPSVERQGSSHRELRWPGAITDAPESVREAVRKALEAKP